MAEPSTIPDLATVKTRLDDRVGVLTLNRPEAMNPSRFRAAAPLLALSCFALPLSAQGGTPLVTTFVNDTTGSGLASSVPRGSAITVTIAYPSDLRDSDPTPGVALYTADQTPDALRVEVPALALDVTSDAAVSSLALSVEDDGAQGDHFGVVGQGFGAVSVPGVCH